MNSSLLTQLDNALKDGSLSADQVSVVLSKYLHNQGTEQSSKLLQILSFIGGGIIFLGIAFWIAQEWKHFGSFAKILSTLGISIGFFVSAVFLGKSEEHRSLSNVFFLLSAALMPWGLTVTYDEFNVDVDSYAVFTQISLLLSAAFLTAYALFKRNLLMFISIFFVTVLFFVVSDWMVADSYHLGVFGDGQRYTWYRILAVGSAWIFLGYAFSQSERKALTSWLYMIGAFAVLLSGLILGDWKPNQSAFWEIIYPGLALGFVFLSVQLKSRSFLVFGSLGFGAYLCKITAEYFSDSLGWPLALILMGCSLIAIAFATVRFKNKHLMNI